MTRNGYNAYKTYLAVKSHFTHASYDYFKYDGKTRATVATFEKRTDRYFFEKLAKKYNESELLEFFVSNFLMNDQLWIGDAFDAHCDEVYTAWKKTQESITYVFGQDCEFMLNKMDNAHLQFDDLFSVGAKMQHPLVFKMWLSGEIHTETIVLLDCILGFMRKANKQLAGEFVWEANYRKIARYKPFVPMCKNHTKFKKLLQEKVSKFGVRT